MEDHNYDVTVASMPRILQEKGDIPKELFDESNFRGQSMIETILNAVDDAGAVNEWKPQLFLVPLIGMQQGIKFSWPAKKEVDKMPLDKQIKLNGFGYKASGELTELQLSFTSGVESPPLRNPAKAQGLTRVEIDSSKTISAVGVLQNPTSFAIYGLRFLDKERTVIVQEIWERDYPDSAGWTMMDVPDSNEIIGLHGNHDGSHIRALGLQVWTPNPAVAIQA